MAFSRTSLSTRGNNNNDNDASVVQQTQSNQRQQQQINSDCVNGDGIVNTEQQQPPSYRTRNFSRIPAVVGGNSDSNNIINETINNVVIEDALNNNNNNDNNGNNETIALNDSTICTVHEQQQQNRTKYGEQQKPLNRNSIMSEMVTVSSNNGTQINQNANTSMMQDDDMKISQNCNTESHKHTGILVPSVLPILVKLSASATGQSLAISQNQALNKSSGAVAAAAVIPTKLSKSTTDIHDIDRLFLNATNGNNDNTPNDNSVAVNSMQCLVSNMVQSPIETTNTKMDGFNNNDLVTIVTITGCTTTESSTGSEMDILARL